MASVRLEMAFICCSLTAGSNEMNAFAQRAWWSCVTIPALPTTRRPIAQLWSFARLACIDTLGCQKAPHLRTRGLDTSL